MAPGSASAASELMRDIGKKIEFGIRRFFGPGRHLDQLISLQQDLFVLTRQLPVDHRLRFNEKKTMLPQDQRHHERRDRHIQQVPLIVIDPLLLLQQIVLFLDIPGLSIQPVGLQLHDPDIGRVDDNRGEDIFFMIR